MKKKFDCLLGTATLVVTIFCCFSSCKDKDNFFRSDGSFFLNGEPIGFSQAAGFQTRGAEDRMFLNFDTSQDELQNSLHFRFLNLFRSDFLYNFDRTDIENQLDLSVYVLVGGDVACDIYDLDYDASTNYLEITYFSEEECVVQGSYDLTFIRREGRRGCNNPRYGDTLRLVSEYFSIDLEGC